MEVIFKRHHSFDDCVAYFTFAGGYTIGPNDTAIIKITGEHRVGSEFSMGICSSLIHPFYTGNCTTIDQWTWGKSLLHEITIDVYDHDPYNRTPYRTTNI